MPTLNNPYQILCINCVVSLDQTNQILYKSMKRITRYKPFACEVAPSGTTAQPRSDRAFSRQMAQRVCKNRFFRKVIKSQITDIFRAEDQSCKDVEKPM